MDTVNISVVVGNSNPDIPLGLSILLDGQPVWVNDAVGTRHAINYEFAETEGPHTLEFVMSGKLPEHTKVDGDTIVSDALLYIENFVFDDLDVTHFVQKSATYTHDCNGTQAMQSHPFYRDLGCNGTVQLKFTSPLYLWVLEQF